MKQTIIYPRRVFWKAFFLAVFFWGALFPARIPAQSALPTALEQAGKLTSEKRAELQRELQRHAQVLEAQSAVIKTVAKLVGPAVVFIETEHATTSRGRDPHVEEAGSGVIIQFKDQFYVLTSRHVIQHALPEKAQNVPLEEIKIDLADGRRIFPTQVWTDADSDVAVLAVKAPDLTPAAVGDSEKLEIGDFVLAVGSPFGLNQSVSFGIISARGRRNLVMGDRRSISLQDFLQTDAAINPGNSGGPLVNLRGEIVGINTAIASDSGVNQGVGFAVPINLFMHVARQLIETGKFTRGYIGVYLSSHFGPALAAELGLSRPMGALISGIEPDSPAALAQLQPGDVILQFNQIPIEDDGHLIKVVGTSEIGRKVPVQIYRNRRTLTVILEVTDRK
ncbi:MAG: trypsin-like peptidase domain-containing protein [Pirellulales bacterium]|nr:trypsin-like peptidase domain-containing protein [Pirellulales bacterium]